MSDSMNEQTWLGKDREDRKQQKVQYQGRLFYLLQNVQPCGSYSSATACHAFLWHIIHLVVWICLDCDLL